MPDASRLAVIAGSFDPVTNGHLDLITRSLTLFDRVTVAVLVNPAKQSLFTLDERVAMIRDVVSVRGLAVQVETFGGLLADYVRQTNASAIVRGLRTAAEFSSEWPTALMNRYLEPGCETVFIVPSASTMHISSRLVREIAALGGDVAGLVPDVVDARLRRRLAGSGPP